MIKFSDELFKQILEELSDLYPSGIQESKNVLPDYDNRDEIFKHLAFCWEEGWISATAIGENTEIAPIEFSRIKITSTGIKHLWEISKIPSVRTL